MRRLLKALLYRQKRVCNLAAYLKRTAMNLIHFQKSKAPGKPKIFTLLAISVVLIFLAAFTNKVDTPKENEPAAKIVQKEKELKFFIISDWGWNGYRKQTEVADAMATMADSLDPKFIVSCGDNFQVNGVASTQDPLWTYSYENVYKHISLQTDWYPVLGNHDYKGNTQAQIDYSKISRRWRMTDHYYKIVKPINDKDSALLIFLDTPPLITEYYEKPGYPDVFKQDTAKQIAWLKSTLAQSTQKVKLVFGHHPVYSASQKHGNTPELIQKLKPIFEKYHVQMYFSGHDHDMQHLKAKGADVDYFVAGTGGDPRPCATSEHSVFSKSVPGYAIVTMSSQSIQVSFIDTKGNTVYSTNRPIK
jgi:tartrate-resistant acid phosphatase type 5